MSDYEICEDCGDPVEESDVCECEPCQRSALCVTCYTSNHEAHA